MKAPTAKVKLPDYLRNYEAFVANKCKEVVDQPGCEKGTMHLLHMGVGLADEFEEFMEEYSRPVIDIPKFKKEAGDVLFYATGFIGSKGLDTNLVMLQNLQFVTYDPQMRMLKQPESMIFNTRVLTSRILGKLKKHAIIGKPISGMDSFVLESNVQSVMRYVLKLCTSYDVTLGDVVAANIEKLDKRFGGKDSSFSDKKAYDHDGQ